MNVAGRLLVLAAVGLLASPPAAGAQVQTRAQQRCIVGLERAGAGVAGALASDLTDCVVRAGQDRLPVGMTVTQCLTADLAGRVAAARTRTARCAVETCGATPSFGVASVAAVDGAFSPLPVVRAMFGTDADTALIRAAVDARGAACQATVARRLMTVAVAKRQAFQRCARSGLRSAAIRSRTDLEACLTTDATRVTRAIATGRASTAEACADVATAGAFPGRCAGASADDLFDCLVADVECTVCRSVNAAATLALPCHRAEQGAATLYCGDRPVATHSIARQWNEEILAAIRRDTPRPTVHARNLLHLSAAMWDAWRAYGGGGTAFLTDESHGADDPDADRAIAISFAAYRVLSHRYALSVDPSTTQLDFDRTMAALGFDRSFTDTTGDAPAAVGNRIGAALIAHGHADGANEHGNYGDATYAPVNGPLIVKLGGTVLADPNRWQPLALDFFITQNGIPIAAKVQAAIGMRWNQVTPFALTRNNPSDVYIDPGPPPLLGTATDADYKAAAVHMIELASQLTPDDGVTIDLSPGAYGNNPLGTNDGAGHPVNPVSGQPYAPQIAKRGDFGRVLAEFWADGPASETPPGHWNVLANSVSDVLPAASKRLGGSGPVLADLEWDVKLYLALNGSVHDAAIAAWGIKRKYDSVRPISMVRYLASRGQSSNPGAPVYDPMGLPLVPGLIEVVTPESSAPGERHEALRRFTHQIAVRAWPGQPADPTTRAGVVWMRGVDWVPYQKSTFVTPAFAGYVSGHSTFSRAAAEVLTAFTGSPYFPGGLGEFVAHADQYLTFERGPTTDVHLQWATYYDAADQAGQSRIWGGIHITADDFSGRITGAEVGLAAYAKARTYFGMP